MTNTEIEARDAKRDLAAELLQSVREMTAGESTAVGQFAVPSFRGITDRFLLTNNKNKVPVATESEIQILRIINHKESRILYIKSFLKLRS